MSNIAKSIESLNREQGQAVTTDAKYALVLAGAGSGKTRVLINRIAFILQQQNVAPWNIFAVTFTNKASNEMRSRLESLLNVELYHAWVGTFHGLAHKFLRIHWQEAGLGQGFQIIDAGEQVAIIKRILKNLNISDKSWPPRQVLGQINSWKDQGLQPQHIESGNNPYLKINLKIYLQYQAHNKAGDLVDFADLLLLMHKTLTTKPSILNHYQQRFQHILVDEFQDTNSIQYALVRLLAGDRANVFVVGDDDQSIYGWRGAKIDHILNFSSHFSPCETFKLEQNYRSTGNILNAANAIINNNTKRLAKKLWTKTGTGEEIKLYQAFSDYDEADFVINTITTLQKNISRKDIAILYRSNAQSRLFEEKLINSEVPYQIYGGLRFFERAEIKDALAYLRLMSNHDDNVAFERIVNRPTRGISMNTVVTIRAVASAQDISMWSAAKQVLTNKELALRAHNALAQFLNLIVSFKKDTLELPLELQTQFILDNSGLIDLYKKEKPIEKSEAKIENLQELINACKQFNYQDEDMSILDAFLAQSALDAGEAQGSDWDECVQLMTLHSAKGLEFPVVFLVGLEEELFPHKLSSNDHSKLAEERRLCYVGITRAQKQLYLSCAASRRIFGSMKIQSPSRFLSELPAELVKEIRIKNLNTNYSKSKPITSSLNTNNQLVSESKFKPGCQVRHPKFGLGVIINEEGSGNSARVQVHFKNVGNKWLVTNYAKLELV